MRLIRYLFLAASLALIPITGFGQTQDSPPNAFANQNPWTQVNLGLDNLNVWSLAINQDNVLFAGTSAGVFRSSDFGDTWDAAGSGLGDNDIGALVIDDEGALFSATHGDGVFRSFDNGDTWEAASDSLENLKIGALAIDFHGILFAGTFLGAVYRSVDHGDTWEEVNDVGFDNPFVPALAINHENVIFSGTDAGVFRSFDDGDTWEAVNEGLENPYIESLLPGSDDALFAGTDRGVFRSLDDGNTWEAINTEDLADKNVRAMTVNANNAIFAGTHEGGVFRSLNYGDAWEPVNEGLTSMDVGSLLITADGTMFAGTVGGGVFRRDAATDVASEAATATPLDFQLARNYPNPFSTATRIRYALPQQAEIELSVYDVSGRAIAVLAKGSRPAGWHEHIYNASHLPSGVYFYRLKANDFISVKHFVLMR